MISQRLKLTKQIGFFFSWLAVVVAEDREILSKNAPIWEISFAKSLSEISFDEIN